MGIILINPMHKCVFNIVCDPKTTDAPSWRSGVLSLSRSDELGAQLLLNNFDEHSTYVALERHMVDEIHLIMGNISHYYDMSFLMSTSRLNEKLFPTTYLEPYGFNLVIDEWSL